jgi:cytochrome P450
MGLKLHSTSLQTVCTLLTFFFAMVSHPDVVRKAHEELDTVVGRDRLPELSDKPFLPYVCAVVNEVLRWYPVLPLGQSSRLQIN